MWVSLPDSPDNPNDGRMQSHSPRSINCLAWSNQIRIQIESMCASLISTKHDVISELFELAELSATSSSPSELIPAADRIVEWFQEAIGEMKQVVQSLQASAQTNVGVDLCFVLIAESAINILSAWNSVERPAPGSIPASPQP